MRFPSHTPPELHSLLALTRGAPSRNAVNTLYQTRVTGSHRVSSTFRGTHIIDICTRSQDHEGPRLLFELDTSYALPGKGRFRVNVFLQRDSVGAVMRAIPYQVIDYDSLDKADHRGNMQLAFDIAHREIGIPKLLDVEDVCDVAKPEERSLMTYIAYWFHAFSQMEKVENAGRRVEKFVNNMQGAWEMQSAYERRMAALLRVLREQVTQWREYVGSHVVPPFIVHCHIVMTPRIWVRTGRRGPRPSFPGAISSPSHRRLASHRHLLD